MYSIVYEIDIHAVFGKQNCRNLTAFKDVYHRSKVISLHGRSEKCFQIAVQTELPVQCEISIEPVIQKIHFLHLGYMSTCRNCAEDTLFSEVLQRAKGALRDALRPVREQGSVYVEECCFDRRFLNQNGRLLVPAETTFN